jgi:hypothetical protein
LHEVKSELAGFVNTTLKLRGLGEKTTIIGLKGILAIVKEADRDHGIGTPRNVLITGELVT